MFDSRTAVHRAQMVKFCKVALEASQPREDCQEFKLLIIFPGAADAAEIFWAPGAFHQVWWIMVKAIYSLNMFLFQYQFTLTTKEKHSVKHLALFESLIYVQFWHEDPVARKASLNDVHLLEALANYLNRADAKAATDTFSRHLWYSSDILNGLSFFDDRNGDDVRTKMVTNLRIRWVSEASWQFTWAIVSHWHSKLHYTKNCCDLWCPLCKWQDEGTEFLG